MEKEEQIKQVEEMAKDHAIFGIEHALRTAVLLGVKINIKTLGTEIKDIWCEKSDLGITIIYSDKVREIQ